MSRFFEGYWNFYIGEIKDENRHCMRVEYKDEGNPTNLVQVTIWKLNQPDPLYCAYGYTSEYIVPLFNTICFYVSSSGVVDHYLGLVTYDDFEIFDPLKRKSRIEGRFIPHTGISDDWVANRPPFGGCPVENANECPPLTP